MMRKNIFKTLKYTFIILGLLLLTVTVNFIIVKKLDREVLEAPEYYVTNVGMPAAFQVPSKFIEGKRFYVKIPLKSGGSMLGFGDTGGGLSMIFQSTLDKRNLQDVAKTGLIKGVMPLDYLAFSDIVADPDFPTPYPLRNFSIRQPFSRVNEPILIVPPMDEETTFLMSSMPEIEAFLGQNFFMEKAWTIDYLNQAIWVNTPLSETEIDNADVQKIGFKKNSQGQSVYGHPSMQIEIDDETIDMLFDTGATIVLSENGKKQMNTDALTIAGSFIAASLFDKWRAEHPEWKYYPTTDMSRDVIEVPQIKIGLHEVGPVLFSKRPDENWSEGMIRSMDKVVKGAIGGSALQYFKVTIDYNNELIKFER